jgi:hypothetical protein
MTTYCGPDASGAGVSRKQQVDCLKVHQSEGGRHMWVGKGDAEDVIKWFQANSRAEWLGFFVAGDRRYNQLLNKVLAQGDIFDVNSGSHIDLFLFGTGKTIRVFGQGRDAEVDVVSLTKLEQGDRWPEILHVGDVNRSAVGVNQITKSSINATHRIVEILDLRVDDLPSLALVRKDFDFAIKEPKLILRTRGRADVEFLIEFIRSMRRVLENKKQLWHRESYDFHDKIDKLPNLMRRIKRQSAFLSELLGSVGFSISAQSLATAILNGSSSEQGLRDAAAQQGLDPAKLEQLLDDPAIVRIRGHLISTHKKLNSALREIENYVSLHEALCTDELKTLIAKFEGKISFRIAVENVVHFFNLVTPFLTKVKKVIKLAAAVKSGGWSLLSE